MSVSIMWRPQKNNGRSLNGQSSFKEALEKVFGNLPKTFTKKDIERLEVMHRLSDIPYDDPYEELIEAINKHSSIEVWAEY